MGWKEKRKNVCACVWNVLNINGEKYSKIKGIKSDWKRTATWHRMNEELANAMPDLAPVSLWKPIKFPRILKASCKMQSSLKIKLST